MIRGPIRIYAEPQVFSMSSVVRGCALVASRGPEPGAVQWGVGGVRVAVRGDS